MLKKTHKKFFTDCQLDTAQNNTSKYRQTTQPIPLYYATFCDQFTTSGSLVSITAVEKSRQELRICHSDGMPLEIVLCILIVLIAF